MRMLRRMLALGLVLGVAGTTSVWAQPGGAAGGRGGNPQQMLQQLDTNGDGVISADEFNGPAQFFERMDADGDGRVTADELTAMQGQRGQRQGQQAQGQGPAAGGQRGAMGNFRERQLEGLREQLGANAEEWAVLQPRIEKVLDAQQAAQQLAASPFGRMGVGARAGRGGAAGPGAGGPAGFGGAAPQQPAQLQALNAALENDSATPEQIQQALTAYREARQKAQADLEAARKELADILSARQEAVLVLAGIIE